jgi:hypothetical protein
MAINQLRKGGDEPRDPIHVHHSITLTQDWGFLRSNLRWPGADWGVSQDMAGPGVPCSEIGPITGVPSVAIGVIGDLFAVVEVYLSVDGDAAMKLRRARDGE